MIHMSPFQSWSIILLLVGFSACVVWLIYALDQARAERSRMAETPATTNVNDPLATMTELRPVKCSTPLALIQNPSRDASPTLYDWKIQGL